MLEVRDLHAGYRTARVLHGLSLGVGETEVVALLGRNGMGKTTLLRAICGLVPPSISTGTVTLAGESLIGLRSYQIARRGVSIVPQGRRVFRSLSVEENLTVAARPGPAGWNLGRVYDLFPRLRERRIQAGGTLSGGEQQMLAIGRSLMTNPRLLVMDEPSEGLAPTVREVILDRLRQLKATGQAALIAEQNVDLALDVADRVSVLGASGTIEWSGRPEELRADESILRELIGLAESVQARRIG
jgi:branched-chain amino acid transport system ATP-binding protein